MTTKTRTIHRCSECGGVAPRWLGRCPACNSWGTVIEEAAAPAGAGHLGIAAGDGPKSITEVASHDADPFPTGVAELDRVLDGGLVPGSVTLLAGEPGMGKSTLLLQALGQMAARGLPTMLVTAEESCAQVRRRADRIGALVPGLLVVAETALPRALAHVDAHAPDVLAVDSIQTILDPDLSGAPGSVTQVRDCAYRLVQQAKERALATVLVGHVTKDGTVAGPRVLEHVVDTVLSVDGDRAHSLRLLHALKHRFGGTQELGLFDMGEHGLVGVPDASARFLVDRRAESTGSAVAAVLEGARPLMVEVQALAVKSTLPAPRRSAAGLDSARLALILAVLQQHVGVALADADVYASVAGGLRVVEPGLDLALALAVASARSNRPVAEHTVAIGEIGLGGEVRSVTSVEHRLAEAARLGFTRAIVAPGAPRCDRLQLAAARDVSEAITLALDSPGAG